MSKAPDKKTDQWWNCEMEKKTFCQNFAFGFNDFLSGLKDNAMIPSFLCLGLAFINSFAQYNLLHRGDQIEKIPQRKLIPLVRKYIV